NRYNKQDTNNFARFYPKRMMAEALYDSISQATGVFLPLVQPPRPTPTGKKPGGGFYGIQELAEHGSITRVMQLPAVPPGRRGTAGDLKVFLDTFGEPRREVVCTCELSTEGNVGQALAL